jgi:FkbM family methyltransferase
MGAGFKGILYKIGGFFLRLVPPGMVVTILSGVNKGFRWVRGSANCPEWLGIYESDLQRLLQSLVKSGMVVYDIGANAGFFTLALSRLAGPNGKVLAFEPQPGNASKIVRHLQLNHVLNATLIQAAVGRSDGLCAFDTGPDDYRGRLTRADGLLQVPVIGLDAFLAAGKSPPDLIKMDIEGGEFDALNGALELLRAIRPVLLLSVHGAEQDEKCRALLLREGYRFDYFGSTAGQNKDLIAKPEA